MTAAEEFAGQGDAPVYTETELYDLQTDPYELTNLVDVASHAAVRDEFRARLLARMAEIDEPPARIGPAEVKAQPGPGAGQRRVEYPNS